MQRFVPELVCAKIREGQVNILNTYIKKTEKDSPRQPHNGSHTWRKSHIAEVTQKAKNTRENRLI